MTKEEKTLGPLDVLDRRMAELLDVMAETRASMRRLETKVDAMQTDMNELRADVNELRADVSELSTRVDKMGDDIRYLGGKTDHFVRFVANEITSVKVSVQEEAYEWQRGRKDINQRLDKIETRLDALERVRG